MLHMYIYLHLVMTPRSPDLVIFVLTNRQMDKTIALPLVHAHGLPRVSFRLKGGANTTIAKLRGGGGGEDYSNTSNDFSLARNIIELIGVLKLGRSGGMLPQENFKFSISETVSGHF